METSSASCSIRSPPMAYAHDAIALATGSSPNPHRSILEIIPPHIASGLQDAHHVTAMLVAKCEDAYFQSDFDPYVNAKTLQVRTTPSDCETSSGCESIIEDQRLQYKIFGLFSRVRHPLRPQIFSKLPNIRLGATGSVLRQVR